MQNQDIIRVLVVDDSVLYRKVIRDVLAQHPQIEVVGVASDGQFAIDKIQTLKPDLLTLDVEMPNVDGLGVLQYLKENRSQTDAIMLSGQNGQGVSTTMQALQLGAFDFILKPNEDSFESSRSSLQVCLFPKINAYLTKRSKSLVATDGQDSSQAFDPPKIESNQTIELATSSRNLNFYAPVEVVVIGVSTGGPVALSQVITKLPVDFPVPILIVQHMPPLFTESLAKDLNQKSQLTVLEAAPVQKIKLGHVYIAPGGKQMKVHENNNQLELITTNDPAEKNCRPSVDYLFRSAAHVFGGKALGVIMTGMGDDGTMGARLLKRKQASILAQDEQSCTVYGMPRSVIENNLADLVCPLDKIADEIQSCVRLSGRV